MSKKVTDEIVAYKGFDSQMKCREFQFEVGQTYTHEGTLKICDSGFHAVEIPLDAWTYYPPTSSQYTTVALGGVSGETHKDSKRVGSKITVSAKLSLVDFIKAHVGIIIEKAAGNIGIGDCGHAAATGDCGCAFTGFGGHAKTGANGAFAIAWYDNKEKRARILVGTPGEEGIKADTFYYVGSGMLKEMK